MVTLVAKHHNGKGLNSVEWEAHRAAKFASVRLKRHIVVHCQLSSLVHVNLHAEVSALVKSDTRNLSSTTNPSRGAWSTASANQTNSRKTYSSTPQQAGEKQCRMGGSPRRHTIRQCLPQTPHCRALSALRSCACKPACGGECVGKE